MNPGSQSPQPIPVSLSTNAVTEELASWASMVTSQNLPDGVLHHGRRLIVDYLAASAVGSTTEMSRKLRAYFAYAEPGDRSTVIAGQKLTASAAAYVNGSAAHGLELDDGYTPGSVHPGACVVPAVLAMAEVINASIEQVATSVIIGVEITARIAAAGHPHVLNHGFHNTPVVGVFGAAAAVAHLLGGTKSAILSALGLAGSYSGGLREYHTDGSEIKRLHAGKAARDGLKCGEMAVCGISGPSTILEGRQGYFFAFARGQWRPEVILDGLGTEWESTRTYVKPYPCCRHLHGPIDAALRLKARLDINSSQIRAIRVGTYELATRFNRANPQSLLEAQLSLPYAVATALRTGRIDLSSFEDRQINDSETQRLASVVELQVDSLAQDSYPKDRPADVQITMMNGDIEHLRISQPLGEPDNPISDKALSEKFRSLATPVLGKARVGAALKEIWDGNDIWPITTGLGLGGQ